MTVSAAVRKAQKGYLLSEVYPPGWDWLPRDFRAKGRALLERSVDSEVLEAARPRPRRRARARARGLTESQRSELIKTFLVLLEGLYTHLPLKRAMYALDPLQRLRLLAQRAAEMEDSAFNYELMGIITRLRDAHTRFVGRTTRYAGAVATLPFLVESYGALPTLGYLVSKVASELSLIGDPNFVQGVELLWWNGVPIDRAVDLYADLETGGRPDSRRARALESLTLRSLQYGPPPDEHWVVLGYLDLNGAEREVKIPWRVITPGRASTAGGAGIASARRYALDPARESARRAKKLLFAHTRWEAERRAGARRTKRPSPTVPIGQWIDTEFQDAVGAKRVDTASGVFGYLRLWTFDVADDRPYVEEVVRLLRMLRDPGLIIDLRANPGGLIWAAERLLQLFGPQPISPTRFSLLATPLTRAMARARQNESELGPWRASLEEAVATGEPYSAAIPITPPDVCNDIGQVHSGPVLAVVDSNTYSAGDLFAAGFYDNGLGILVTVGTATGGGGANVWWPDQVQEALLGTEEFEQRPLPVGIGYSISVRRATRGAGEAVGAPIEDVGVRGHRPYAMTKKDLLEDNRELLNFCGRLLASSPSTRIEVAPAGQGASSVRLITHGLDRLDVYLDGRPSDSKEIVDGPLILELPQGWQTLELQGHSGGELRQRRRL